MEFLRSFALCSDVISRGNQSDGVAKCQLFSEAYYLIIPRGKGNSVKFLAQNQFGRRVRVQLENCEYLWKFSRYAFSFCYYIKIVTTLKLFFKRNWNQFSAGLRVYIILRHFCHISGLPLLIVLLSMLIASTQDGGIHGYVHGDL